jgi:glycosyltransferase involved in cell wall biosynthesis
MSDRQQILIVGMADSIHVARWLSQFADQPIDFALFPSSPHRRIHPIIKKLTSSTSNNMSVTIRPPSMKWLALPLSALDIPFENYFRSRLLRRLINQTKFNLIHVLELQHAGYLLLSTKLAPNLPKVFITNWGSDIYWFQQFPKHMQKILRLLSIASFYSAECQRDIEIIRQLGYTGSSMPVIPNSGGINMDEVPHNAQLPSQRRKILIKGYTGFVGQALTAIKACEYAADHLHNYEVVIYSASLKARVRALKLRYIHNVQVAILKKKTPHHEMLKLFSEARVYVGVSLSDGISTSLLEAMATGCYPIQTNTSCADEWLTSISGSIVSLNSIEPHKQIGSCIIAAIQSDEIVNQAAIDNLRTIRSKAAHNSINSITQSFYNSIVLGSAEQ